MISVTWKISDDFEEIRVRHNIPEEVKEWTVEHVAHWFAWAVGQFNLQVNENEWRLTGQQLCELSWPEFKAKLPSDADNDVFWNHFQVLCEHNFVATPCEALFNGPHAEVQVVNPTVGLIPHQEDRLTSSNGNLLLG